MKTQAVTTVAAPLACALLPLCVGLLLSACGGGGGGGNGGADPATNPATASSLVPSRSLANLCASPRPNTADTQGSVAQEKAYLRSFVDESYLWYRDVPGNLVEASYATAPAYFEVLKTPAVTASGAAVDQFHWSQTTASWNAAMAGQAQDYGIRWAALANLPPRNWVVSEVAPGSPAAMVGIQRGFKVTSIDGVNFVYDNTAAGVAALNQGLSPTMPGAHGFGFDGGAERSMSPATYQVITVQHVQTIATANGTVGYFTFDSQIAQSEDELIAAINQLKNAQVSDLVIDMRYNGGGLLYIASELAYMIAGPAATAGKVFEQASFNDKLVSRNTVYGFAFGGKTPIGSLPHLDLKHVTVLATHATASASESVINSLRGVDVTVDLMGANTRGKPYGFFPQDNCGYTYFAIQFKGVNNKGFGDYADGFTPTCAVADDYTHARGDSAEAMLKAALGYRLNGLCPVNASAQLMRSGGVVSGGGSMELVRPLTPEWRILTTQ